VNDFGVAGKGEKIESRPKERAIEWKMNERCEFAMY
jgi:hypothetical protein